MSDAVDLALVLAVDCSSSVEPREFRIQMQGIAAALRHPKLQSAIAAGRERRIALTLMLWSGADSQAVAVPWRILATGADLESVAAEIAATERSWQLGGTAIGLAIDYAAGILGKIPFAATRRVIDVSGDGPDNVTSDAASARDRAVAQGITINGLPITKHSLLLPAYYLNEVIGGRDAFIEPAPDIQAFHATILRKLLREIGNPVS
jgi:hypothetical protein